MRKKGVLLGLGALLVGLLWAGCATRPEITPLSPPEHVVVGELTPGEPLAAARYPMAAHAPAERIGVDSSNCIVCHTDQETLQLLAIEPEEEETLSEGEG